eukprot:2686170-Alexandrium_andersonii.AAC.1
MSQAAKSSSTKRICDIHAYHALVSKEVLTKIHHFHDPADAVAHSSRGEKFQRNAFQVDRSQVWKKLFGIKG